MNIVNPSMIIKYLVKFITIMLYKGALHKIIDKEKKKRSNRKVLVLLNSGIGDALMALPMVNRLADNDYEVYALVNEYTDTIARLCSGIKSQFIIRNNTFRNYLSLIIKLNKYMFRYYIGALPSNLIRDAFWPLFLMIPIRIKHSSPHDEIFRNYDFIFDHIVTLEDEKNNTDGNLTLLSKIDKDLSNGPISYGTALNDDKLSLTRLQLENLGYTKDKITVGMHPGCKETWNFKRWPGDRFSCLIDCLLKEKKVQIVLFGGPDEKELAASIIKSTEIPPINMTGKLSLEETIFAISLCDIFISNDSGLMHVATMFDIPVIALFGKSDEIKTGPYGSKHMIIKKEDVKDITVEEVFLAASKLLNNKSVN